MNEMYKGIVNSPETVLTASISDSDTTINILDDSSVPIELPTLMVIGVGELAETVKVTAKSGTELTVERGFQGTARAWESGTVIARNFTEYDYEAMRENINYLREKTTALDEDTSTLYEVRLVQVDGKPVLRTEEVV